MNPLTDPKTKRSITEFYVGKCDACKREYFWIDPRASYQLCPFCGSQESKPYLRYRDRTAAEIAADDLMQRYFHG